MKLNQIMIVLAVIIVSLGLLFGCSSGGGSGTGGGIDPAALGTWLEMDSDFSSYQDDGIYIEFDGDVYDVDTDLDGSAYYYRTDWVYGVIMKLSQLSNGSWSGYNYEYDVNMFGTYTLGSSGGLTTLIIVTTSPSSYSGTDYYVKAD